MKKALATGLVFAFGLCAFSQNVRPGIPIGVDFGIFMPVNSDVRSALGSTWYRVGVTPISLQNDSRWRFTFDVAVMSQSRNGNKASLTPVTFGMTKSFGDPRSMGARPYVAIRVGPYWGNVDAPALGVDDNKIGMDINGAFGLTFNRMFYVEARYDYFSDFEGVNFSGFFFSAGVKLFEFRL